MTSARQVIATLLSPVKAAAVDWQQLRTRVSRGADAAYGAALRVPTPVLTAGLGAAASVPLTAAFGLRDERGRKRYGRNALVGAVVGASAPMVHKPQWLQNHEENARYQQVLDEYKAERAQQVASATKALEAYNLKPGAGVDQPTRAANMADYLMSMTQPRADVLRAFGTPASRWRTLFSRPQAPATVAALTLPFDYNLMSAMPAGTFSGVPVNQSGLPNPAERMQDAWRDVKLQQLGPVSRQAVVDRERWLDGLDPYERQARLRGQRVE